MWALAIVAVLLVVAVILGVKEVFSMQRRSLIVAVASTLALSLANNYYGWGVRGDVLIVLALGLTGAIRFFEK